MRKQIDPSDIFDDDELTLQTAWSTDTSPSHSQAPFKIGLNFLREDDNQPTSMTLDHSVSYEKYDTKFVSPNLQPGHQGFSDDQIFKVNSVNEKLRLIVLYENTLPEQEKTTLNDELSTSENKNLKRRLRERELDFVINCVNKHAALIQTSLEPIKMTRLYSIPESKRKFYLKKSDLEDIEKKKALKALTFEKVKQFRMKKGLSAFNSETKKMFQEKSQAIKEKLIESRIEIEEERVTSKINQVMITEATQTKSDLKESIRKYRQELKAIQNESLKQIHQEINYRHIIVNSRNIKKIDTKRKAKNATEDLNAILGVVNLFNMMPNIGLQVKKSTKSRSDLENSFSKDF